MADEEIRDDEVLDEPTAEETVESVDENLETHEESDAEKWDKIFGMVDGLQERLDKFEAWVNEAIGGIDKTEADEAEDTAATSGDYEEDEVADLDKSFYARQAEYLKEGGY